MNIIQCTFCKKPFQSLGRRICNECLEQIDKDFITVRDYIYEHKQTNMDTVSEETGVSKQIIMYLLKEGRLILDDDSGGGGVLFCEVCKKPINSGRLCKDCKGKVASTMQQSVSARPAAAPKNEAATNFKATAKLKRK
jgi:hypothetical protein